MIEKTFNTGNLALNYMESSPSGPPVLLLHGFATRWQSFNQIIPELAKDWHVYALDLRGHGKSGRAKTYRIQDNVPDIELFIRECIKAPTIVIGHSYGGMIGILLAASNPELVKGLIIGDSLLSTEAFREHSQEHIKQTIFWRELAKAKNKETVITMLKNELVPSPDGEGLVPAFQVFGDNQRYFESMAKAFGLLDPELLTAHIEGFEQSSIGYQPDKLFSFIKCPVLLLQANPKLGGLLNDRDLQAALQSLPKARHAKVNTGHFLHIDDKEAVLEALVPFLQSLKD